MSNLSDTHYIKRMHYLAKHCKLGVEKMVYFPITSLIGKQRFALASKHPPAPEKYAY